MVFLVALKLTFSPEKHTEPAVEDPPVLVQKSVLDGQIWLSLLVVLAGGGAWFCNNGENGEFLMETF